MTSTVTMIDLFAGCGGLTAGFRAAGNEQIEFVPVAAVELDPEAAATYAANHGDHVFVGDINDWLESDIPEADVILGGPPCQGFSALGSRDPADPRNQLWQAYVNTVERIRPSYFVLENVPQFLASDQFAQLEDTIAPGKQLQDYELEVHQLNAADYETPQSRRRAIVIGRRGVLPALNRPQPTSRIDQPTVRKAFYRLRRRVTRIDLPSRSVVVGDVEIPGPFATAELHVTRRFEKKSLQRFEEIPTGGNRFDIPDQLLPLCWKNHTSGSSDVMGRLHWDRPSVTIRTEFFKPEKGRYLHPTEHRSITHREAARIQGFPDDYLWHGSKSAIARQIGNAVPVPLATAIARHLLAAVEAGNLESAA